MLIVYHSSYKNLSSFQPLPLPEEQDRFSVIETELLAPPHRFLYNLNQASRHAEPNAQSYSILSHVKRSNSKSGFKETSRDVQLHIFKYTDTKSICRLKLTCKNFYVLLSTSFGLRLRRYELFDDPRDTLSLLENCEKEKAYLGEVLRKGLRKEVISNEFSIQVCRRNIQKDICALKNYIRGHQRLIANVRLLEETGGPRFVPFLNRDSSKRLNQIANHCLMRIPQLHRAIEIKKMALQYNLKREMLLDLQSWHVRKQSLSRAERSERISVRIEAIAFRNVVSMRSGLETSIGSLFHFEFLRVRIMVSHPFSQWRMESQRMMEIAEISFLNFRSLVDKMNGISIFAIRGGRGVAV